MRVAIVGNRWRGHGGLGAHGAHAAERDFDHVEPVFFSTSQAGGAGPVVDRPQDRPLQDANDLAALAQCDVVVTCQGGDYTNDGASAPACVRLERLLDRRGFGAAHEGRRRDHPRSGESQRDRQGARGWRTRLRRRQLHRVADDDGAGRAVPRQPHRMDHVDDLPGGFGRGAQNMRELVEQMGSVHAAAAPLLRDPASAILDIDRVVTEHSAFSRVAQAQFGTALAGNLIPWIDKDMGNGVEPRRMEGQRRDQQDPGPERDDTAIPVEGICVRVGAMRCHSQAMTIKLKRDLPLVEIELIAEGNEWVTAGAEHARCVDRGLAPAGRQRHARHSDRAPAQARMGGDYISAFTVGDQLLWGAAEPIRRMLRILLERARSLSSELRHDATEPAAGVRSMNSRPGLAEFARERDWDQFHAPKNLAMALAGEVGELLEHFQWLSEQQSADLPADVKDAVALEMADVLLYLVRLADKLASISAPRRCARSS
jgi:aspartate-semialdehyde dehydrogenase